MSWYVGKLATGTRVPFSHNRVPTKQSHGRTYKFVEGPFKTRDGAHHFASVWNKGGQITQDMAEEYVAMHHETHNSRVMRMRARSGRYGNYGEPGTEKAPLSTIRILFRAPDHLSLYGVPYDMRPGQSPGDLWRAVRDWQPLPLGRLGGARRPNLDDWIWLGQPGWWGSLTPERQAEIKAFLDKHREEIPQGPYEWSRIHDFGDVRGITPKRPYSTADGRTFETLEKAIGYAGHKTTREFIYRRSGPRTSEPYYVLEPDGSQHYVVS